jgi:hypothetical protein
MATLTSHELHAYLRLPEVDRAELGGQIATFVRNEFGMVMIEAGTRSSLWRAHFSYRIDESGQNVEDKPFVDGMRQWTWTFAVSCRAPLITCRTYTLGPTPDRAKRPGGTYYQKDAPPRAAAVEWTERIARQFELTYVEARALEDLNVDYDEVAPDFGDALDHDPDFPNAFQVLFLQH